MKEKTVNRAQAWKTIADNLTKQPDFKVSKRSVRDRFSGLVDKFKKKTSKELSASGISPEPTELDRLLEEITERMEVSEQMIDDEDEKARAKVQLEQKQAQDIRLKAMEVLSQTKKRSEEEQKSSQPKCKKGRSNGSEVVEYLWETANEEMALKEKDVEVRSKQVEKESNRQQLLDQQHHDLMAMLLTQQQQQQQQQQEQQQQFMQMQTIMAQQQQQQQYQMLMAILEKK